MTQVGPEVLGDEVQQLRNRCFEVSKSLLNGAARLSRTHYSLELDFLIFEFFDLDLLLFDLDFLVLDLFDLELDLFVKLGFDLR